MAESHFHIYFTAEAQANYQQIKSYLLNEFGRQVYITFNERLTGILNLIQVNPHLFPIFYEPSNIRRIVIQKEVSVFYEITENEVMILSIFDNRRNSPNI